MKVYINKEELFLESKKTLNNVLEDLKLQESKGMAVAVNDTVIPRSEWSNFFLNEEDKILLVKATQGG